MTTPSDELQKIFRTLADPTRVRILRLVEREPLVVQELMEVLGMPQSKISRHLGVLREAGLVTDQRNGTFVVYRYEPPTSTAWQDAWKLVVRQLESDSTAQRDVTALARVVQERAEQARTFFDQVGAEWDGIRSVFNDSELRARALARLVEPQLRVLDLGTGTGILALELAGLGAFVIGVDNSDAMLEAARRKWDADAPPSGTLTLRKGDAGELPLGDGEVDAAIAHMVLHSLPSPEGALLEMGRCVRPGGRVVAIDFLPHSFEWMRTELGALWLGFETDVVRGWFAAAGLGEVHLEVFEPQRGARELPGTFIASATVE
jgi:ubiquinone/menaquinone biosynthesis C-methylase UbiE/predicted transcriptional regulator